LLTGVHEATLLQPDQVPYRHCWVDETVHEAIGFQPVQVVWHWVVALGVQLAVLV